jgi:hypothetical protein
MSGLVKGPGCGRLIVIGFRIIGSTLLRHEKQYPVLDSDNHSLASGNLTANLETQLK